MAMYILESLPEHLRDKAISLACLGVDNCAWFDKDALEVIVNLRQQDLAILGGDVFQWEDSERIEFAYDNWYLDKNSKWSWREYVMKSYEYTRSYILAYLERNEQEGIAFSFVVADPTQYDKVTQSSR